MGKLEYKTVTQFVKNRDKNRMHVSQLLTHSFWFIFLPRSGNWHWRSSIQSAKTRPGADCGSDNELLIAKFRLKLKKVGKTTRPFRYDLNQIPISYTVEVRNRFKGLDLIEYELKNYAWRTMDGGSWHCTGGRDQDHHQDWEVLKGKMLDK